MRKVLLVAVMAVASLAANAQAYIGGTVGVSTETLKNVESVSNTTVRIAPTFGYSFNDKWGMGVSLGYGYDTAKASTFFGTVKGTCNTFYIAPYARFTFAKAGMVDFLVDGVLGYSVTSVKGADKCIHGIGIGLEPGIAINVCKSVSIVAKTTDLLSWKYEMWGDLSDSRFTFGLNTIGLQLGAYVNL
ncbi:MAG: outer membrane beta-barrel protein [Bacteroidaceae bacterium]|nr:outer membrane beta-barrel protein [Bacteroidaceae bacterium]